LATYSESSPTFKKVLYFLKNLKIKKLVIYEIRDEKSDEEFLKNLVKNLQKNGIPAQHQYFFGNNLHKIFEKIS